MNPTLNMRQSQALRGMAILGIILHNYCHFLKFAVKENEYTFTAEKPRQLLEKLLSLDADLFIHILSFFGHYGVPVFLFISGYGLVKKYEKRREEREERRENSTEQPKGENSSNHTPHSSSLTPRIFLWRHFKKLFRLMIWGYLLFVAVYFLRNTNGAEIYSWNRVLAQLTMTVNFLFEHPDRIIKPGPYWFFGLMMQLYALYIFVIHRWRSPWLFVALVLVCWLIQVMAPTPDALNYIRYNFIGGVMPFVAGIVLSRYEDAKVRGCENTSWACKVITPLHSHLSPLHSHLSTPTFHLSLLLISAAAVFAGSFWFHSWLWVPLFIVMGAVATVRLMPEWLLKPCAWVGSISAALFVMHPLLREVIIPHYRHTDIYYGIAVYLLASMAASMLLQWLTSKPKS